MFLRMVGEYRTSSSVPIESTGGPTASMTLAGLTCCISVQFLMSDDTVE